MKHVTGSGVFDADHVPVQTVDQTSNGDRSDLVLVRRNAGQQRHAVVPLVRAVKPDHCDVFRNPKTGIPQRPNNDEVDVTGLNYGASKTLDQSSQARAGE